MAKSTIYLRNLISQALLERNTFSINNLYVGLFSQTPTLDNATDGTEFGIGVDGSGYKRVTATSKWTQNTNSLPAVSYELNTLIGFESKSKGWNGNYSTATITGVGLWDHEQAGNCLMYTNINPTRTIDTNQDMDIPVSGIVIDFTTV